MSYYERLREICAQNSISPTALLKKLQISTSKLTAWENGSMPNSKFVILISEYFGVSTDYLLTGKETPSVNECLKPDERQFIDKFNRLKDIDKGKILERMDVIYESYPPAAVQEPPDVLSEPAEPTVASLDQKETLGMIYCLNCRTKITTAWTRQQWIKHSHRPRER